MQIATDPNTLEQLLILHPQLNLQIPALPEGAPLFHDTGALCRFIKSQCYKKEASSPGPSGWTFRLFSDSLVDDVCNRALTALILDILNGALPQECAALLTASNLVPLLKFAHGKPNGIRPIACGEVFYRHRGQLLRLALRREGSRLSLSAATRCGGAQRLRNRRPSPPRLERRLEDGQ